MAAGLALAGGCGGGGDPGDAATGPSTAPPPEASVPTDAAADGSGPVATPSELLMFSAPRIGGGEIDASIYQGRPVLLWFWSPW